MRPARALVLALLFSGVSLAQAPVDLSRLPEPKDFRAFRSSSNNPDLESNDDSRRPIPGETVTLANLTGPGVVTHIWLTVAANEYAWPRLLRLRIYYDGSRTPSVDDAVSAARPTAAIGWGVGTCVVIDNYRLLHRRPAVAEGAVRVLERTYAWEA